MKMRQFFSIRFPVNDIKDFFSVQFTVVIDPELAEELAYEAPTWIIIVSVLAGVMLLGLIVILLWKVRICHA